MPGVRFKPQIDIEVETQRGEHLCWIAVAVSVDHYFNKSSTLTQCELVRRLKHTGDCCTPDVLAGGRVPEKCDKPGRLETALAAVSHLAKDTPAHPNPSEGPMRFDDIRKEIDAGRPVCAYVGSGFKSEGHFILISGYHAWNGKQYLYVEDPNCRDGSHPYDEVVNRYQFWWKWEYTYRLKGRRT